MFCSCMCNAKAGCSSRRGISGTVSDRLNGGCVSLNARLLLSRVLGTVDGGGVGRSG